MKKILIILTLLFISVNYNAFSICEGYQDGGIATITYLGCTYEYTYCYRVNEFGLHEIAIMEINILFPCTDINFDNIKSALTDAIIAEIAQMDFIYSEWGQQIPECPSYLCLIRWNDKICYDGFTYDPITKNYYMNVCEDIPPLGPGEYRSCSQTIRVCWTNDPPPKHIQVTRVNSGDYGKPCPAGCDDTNCD